MPLARHSIPSGSTSIPRSSRSPQRSSALVALLVAAAACGEMDRGPYVSEVEEGLGVAVAILVDNSGSMDEPAGSDRRPKYEVAREAIAEMLAATDSFIARRPDFAVKVAIFRFSGLASRVLPIQAYDREKVREAIAGIPDPGGGTAIGRAMRAAREELYRSGVFRKNIIVITDGENTSGPHPRAEAIAINERSQGSVRMYFVAFDTDPDKFGFLPSVGGELLAAGNAEALRVGLNDLYQGRILVEAVQDDDVPN